LAAALSHFGLEAGCTVFAPVEAVFSPLWTRAGRGAWEAIKGHLDRSMPLARTIGSPVIVVVIKSDEERDLLSQEEAAVEQLKRAGDLAAAQGLLIGLETMVSIPGLLLKTTQQVVALLERVGHPAVRLVFDTGHVQMMDGDVLAAYAEARDHICAMQLADMPGRVEPGAGKIDFSALLSEARRDGNAGGLIELEHGWTERSAAAERAGIEALRRIDASIEG
jgi:hydroxypyruvate isomerase